MGSPKGTTFDIEGHSQSYSDFEALYLAKELLVRPYVTIKINRKP